MRRSLTAAAVALGLVMAGVVGYRVFAPAETITTARASYPEARLATSGVSGELPRAPLIVDGRLRIYAAKRQVWADTPVGARTETTPFWSYRRWPAQVVGVVVTATHTITKWSDGELVAIDTRTGVPAWRARSPADRWGYTGGRTGAVTVYQPPGLVTGRGYGGREVVVSAGERTVLAFDAVDGSPLWNSGAAAGCRYGGFTGPGFYAELDRCAGGVPVLRRYDLISGTALPDWRPPGAQGGWRLEPVGCAVGRSLCAAARTGEDGRPDRGWLFGAAGPDVAEAPAVAPPGTWLAGDVAVGAGLRAVAARDGTPLWTWRRPDGSVDTSPVRIVAAEPGAVYLVSEQRTLIILDPATGLELARTPLDRFGAEPQHWTAGLVHARDRYIALERLRPGPAPSAHLNLRPVLLAGG